MANLPSPIEELQHPLLTEKKIQLFVKRDDLIHPDIMGNKWRKLKYNIEEVKKQGKNGLVTMGGAYSNHIYATAAAGEVFGLQTFGIIRGDELNNKSNPTLRFASEKSMQLRFVDRKTFREIREHPELLSQEFADWYFLPEGGTNELAVKGCSELPNEIKMDYSLIVLPIGTGGTFCGVLNGVSDHQTVLGISSLKGDFVKREVKELINQFGIDKSNYEVNTEYHFGGYGKTKRELIDFINWFKEFFGVPLDPIYTGKTFFAVWDMIKTDKFEENLRIVLLHTGGLQGISGFNRKKRDIIQ